MSPDAPDATTRPRFRQQQIRRNLEKRSQVLAAVRAFFQQNGFLEVQTPVRIPAPAPEAYIDPFESEEWFLQTSPELCMKRLLAAGYERIYQISTCFRKGERGSRHLPELTLLEWYQSGVDYLRMMAQTETLLRWVCRKAGYGDWLTYQGQRIDLRGPWPRMPVAQAFERFASMSMAEALAAGRFDEIVALEIEPQLGLGRPLFLYDYPAACSALARLKPDNPHLAERFELYLAGMELCNAFSELNDPIEQRRRFAMEIQSRRRQGKPAPPMPEAFLAALPAMPPAAGNALGIDRLVMLLCDVTTIDPVAAFTPEEL